VIADDAPDVGLAADEIRGWHGATEREVGRGERGSGERSRHPWQYTRNVYKYHAKCVLGRTGEREALARVARYDGRVGPLVAIVALVLAAAGYGLTRAPRRSPEAQAELDRAVAAVDRELAADLELTAMFDQTKQAFVLENGQYGIHAGTLAREVPEAAEFVNDLYGRLPAAESAMERRGPAGSLKDADREVVESWEGDAREAQRRLRAAATLRPVAPWKKIIARLRGSSPSA